MEVSSFSLAQAATVYRRVYCPLAVTEISIQLLGSSRPRKETLETENNKKIHHRKSVMQVKSVLWHKAKQPWLNTSPGIS